VQPSLIRVEADEATYNLHVMMRVELEIALVEGRLDAAGLPDAWNRLMEQYLGVRPPDDATGVLQDIHWSAGLLGYFATYTLGNLISAQLWEPGCGRKCISTAGCSSRRIWCGGPPARASTRRRTCGISSENSARSTGSDSSGLGSAPLVQELPAVADYAPTWPPPSIRRLKRSSLARLPRSPPRSPPRR
jgi:hypothetical protein